MFSVKIVTKDQKQIEQLGAENDELRELIKEQDDALVELAEIIEEIVV